MWSSGTILPLGARLRAQCGRGPGFKDNKPPGTTQNKFWQLMLRPVPTHDVASGEAIVASCLVI